MGGLGIVSGLSLLAVANVMTGTNRRKDNDNQDETALGQDANNRDKDPDLNL